MASYGSSPLARGTHEPAVRGTLDGRLIPARAGNTASLSSGRRKRTAHPRSRGEHPPALQVAMGFAGSSPLARGTRCAVCPADDVARLIPARAGNTGSTAVTRPQVTAHPRSRGEHKMRVRVSFAPFGSSPLARGTLGTPGDTVEFSRLIPARAGNTLCSHLRAPFGSAHPRSRGEHATACLP